MAKIEMANLTGEKVKHANISGVVGLGGRNERNDVMLIQALFQVAGSFNYLIKKDIFGLEKDEKLPEVTGELDWLTVETIWKFQRHNTLRVLSVDGKVHPASYGNRLLKNPYRKPVMMITRLNMEAAYSAKQRFNNDIALAIKSFAPSIVFKKII